MVTVKFTEDFATKKKGEEWACDSMLASYLINVDKVAVLADSKEVKAVKTKEVKATDTIEPTE